MRISYKVALVGGFPIAIAAIIAIIAWFLLNEAERARGGAVLAGSMFRNLEAAVVARDNYLKAFAGDRGTFASQFDQSAATVRRDLAELTGYVRDPAHRTEVANAERLLAKYVEQMRQVVSVTTLNDRLIADMAARADSLIALTEQARARQHRSNADIVASLTERDARLREMRDVVDRAQDMRAALADLAVQQAALAAAAESAGHPAEAGRRRAFALIRMKNAAADLAGLLRTGGGGQADELTSLASALEASIRREPPGDVADPVTESDLNAFVDRLLKVTVTDQRALHEEVAQLLTYSVQSAETEQATQNIAIATLKLSQRTADALARRDPVASGALLEESRNVAATVASLPISPLIQSEMIDALAQWSDALGTVTDGLRTQNEMIAEMNATAAGMTGSARKLNDTLATDSARIGDFIRQVLIAGAAFGLLLGSGIAFAVAHSITHPLELLQARVRELAADPSAGAVELDDRRDELGDIARAASFFVTEIGNRERALRKAKERADRALEELRQTQAELIQAEKLASLGQLVAGVAHEINTPLGVALTTATALGDEARQFGDAAARGQVGRSQFARFVDRMNEGSRLLFYNLTRAADLVHSFKQVAADQASGERRKFDMQTWLNELLTSLGPMIKRTGHRVSVECRPGLTVDTYPGALAQVLTNLIVNAAAHAYDEGQSGRVSIVVAEPRPGRVRIEFGDDGSGIAPENLSRVFDPFFTTGRSRGNTGLGLHIVYNLVTRTLNGRIDVESRLGEGTRFIIDLPAQIADQPATEPSLVPA
jgi:signal transduction histidine kinase